MTRVTKFFFVEIFNESINFQDQVTRDKLGTKRDLQAPHGSPDYDVKLNFDQFRALNL